MKKLTAIIACDNGLGHIRRGCLLSLNRVKMGEDVVLFAPISSVLKFKNMFSLNDQKIKLVDFNTNSSIDNFQKSLEASISWLNKLPKLNDFDNVICDNLPEILSIRPDCIIHAQFFWHEIAENISSEYKLFCRKLLKELKPIIFGCEFFTMENVKKQPGFKSVNLYKNPRLVETYQRKSLVKSNSLLITGGSTNIINSQLKPIVKKFIEKKPISYDKIFLDPQLMPKRPPKWIKEADFSVEMFCEIKSCVCRPGLGILTDLLTLKIKPYLTYEDNNYEMAHNARTLINNEMGYDISKFKFS